MMFYLSTWRTKISFSLDLVPVQASCKVHFPLSDSNDPPYYEPQSLPLRTPQGFSFHISPVQLSSNKLAKQYTRSKGLLLHCMSAYAS
ncbi:hypothetical protein AAZX31_14G138200 [Glycine max]